MVKKNIFSFRLKKSLPLFSAFIITTSLTSCGLYYKSVDGWNRNVKGIPPQWQRDIELGKPRVPALNPGGSGVVMGEQYRKSNSYGTEYSNPYEPIAPQKSTMQRNPSVAPPSQMQARPPMPYAGNAAIPSPAQAQQNIPNIASMIPKETVKIDKADLGFEPSPLEPSGDLDNLPWMQSDSGAFGEPIVQAPTRQYRSNQPKEDLTEYGGAFDPYAEGEFKDGKFDPPSYQELERMGGDPFSPLRQKQDYKFEPMSAEVSLNNKAKPKAPSVTAKLKTKPVEANFGEPIKVASNNLSEKRAPKLNDKYIKLPSKNVVPIVQAAPVPNFEPLKIQTTNVNDIDSLDYLKVVDLEPEKPVEIKEAPKKRFPFFFSKKNNAKVEDANNKENIKSVLDQKILGSAKPKLNNTPPIQKKYSGDEVLISRKVITEKPKTSNKNRQITRAPLVNNARVIRDQDFYSSLKNYQIKPLNEFSSQADKANISSLQKPVKAPNIAEIDESDLPATLDDMQPKKPTISVKRSPVVKAKTAGLKPLNAENEKPKTFVKVNPPKEPKIVNANNFDPYDPLGLKKNTPLKSNAKPVIEGKKYTVKATDYKPFYNNSGTPIVSVKKPVIASDKMPLSPLNAKKPSKVANSMSDAEKASIFENEMNRKIANIKRMPLSSSKSEKRPVVKPFKKPATIAKNNYELPRIPNLNGTGNVKASVSSPNLPPIPKIDDIKYSSEPVITRSVDSSFGGQIEIIPESRYAFRRGAR